MWCWNTYSIAIQLITHCVILYTGVGDILVFRTFYPLSPFYRFIRVVRQINGRTLRNKEEEDAFGITSASLRENGILKTDTKEKVDIRNRQFQSLPSHVRQILTGPQKPLRG